MERQRRYGVGDTAALGDTELDGRAVVDAAVEPGDRRLPGHLGEAVEVAGGKAPVVV